MEYGYFELVSLLEQFGVLFELVFTIGERLFLDDIINVFECELFGVQCEGLFEVFDEVFGGVFVLHGVDWYVVGLVFSYGLELLGELAVELLLVVG